MLGICKVLKTWASKYINGIKMITIVLSPTQPTPLIATLSAGHVVTTRDLFYSYLTFRAIAYIATFNCPLFKISIKCHLALDIAMPFQPTFKTYFKSTLASSSLLFAFFNIVIAIWRRTPFQVGIQIYIYVFLKL